MQPGSPNNQLRLVTSTNAPCGGVDDLTDHERSDESVEADREHHRLRLPCAQFYVPEIKSAELSGGADVDRTVSV